MKVSWLLVAIGLTGCVDKGDEENVPLDGKLDSFRSPTDHGELAFGAAQSARITADQAFHTWTFALGGTAEVRAFTARKPHAASIDTVLYLYRKGSTGWGPYIARNDDDGRGDWSSITRTLDAGDYRVLVKGFNATTRGSFLVTGDCSGAGCVVAPTCLFGGTYYELNQDPDFTKTLERRLTSAAGLSELDKQRAVLAIRESSHTDVQTAEEAFERADENEIIFSDFTHDASGRAFASVEYGAGDNSYGAIFIGDTADIGAAINDGDLYRCVVQ